MVSKKAMKKEALYVAVDESNHNNGNDIIVAVFSIFPEDKNPERFGKREYLTTRNFLDKKGRDYRFTTLAPFQDFEKTSYNLYLITPFLIKNFIKDNKEFLELNILLDGHSKNKWEKILRWELKSFKTEVSNYWGKKKRRNYPLLLQAADVTASDLYKGFCSDILNNKKIVKLSLEELLRVKKKFDTL